MDRKENWYSVIQFMPNKLRGEIINVGLLLHQPEDGKLKYKLIQENNPKIKSLLNNNVLNASYKLSKEYINHYLENISDSDTMFEKGIYNNSFLDEFNNHLPDGFILSDPSFSLSSNTNVLFEQLMLNYIGKDFIVAEEKPNEVSTKKHLSDFFVKEKLLGTKIKSNVKINPIKDIKNMQYSIDFVYKNGVINLIHTVPHQYELLNNWFSRVNTFSNNYDSNAGIYLVYEDNTLKNDDNTIIDMFKYLKCHDERIKTIKFDSKEMHSLTESIQSDGKYVEEFEAELA